MDRHLFGITNFTKEEFPNYRCPRCNSHLALGEFSDEDDAETRCAKDDPDFDSDWVRREFRADLKCTSARCGQRVLCVGTGSVFHLYGEQHRGGWHEEYLDKWTPSFFLPALEVFEIPANTPEEVRLSVWASFRVLFLSSGSALNEVRNALEFLMDHLEVPRRNPDGKTLALHKRVEMMPACSHAVSRSTAGSEMVGKRGNSRSANPANGRPRCLRNSSSCPRWNVLWAGRSAEAFGRSNQRAKGAGQLVGAAAECIFIAAFEMRGGSHTVVSGP